MQICHHKALQIHVDNDNKCEVSLRFWIIILKIIKKKKKRFFFPCLSVTNWFNEPNFFLYCTNNTCRLTCDRWEERKGKKQSCSGPAFDQVVAIGKVLSGHTGICTVTSSGILHWVFFWFEHGSIHIWTRIMHSADSYQLWKVLVSLCRKSKK